MVVASKCIVCVAAAFAACGCAWRYRRVVLQVALASHAPPLPQLATVYARDCKLRFEEYALPIVMLVQYKPGWSGWAWVTGW